MHTRGHDLICQPEGQFRSQLPKELLKKIGPAPRVPTGPCGGWRKPGMVAPDAIRSEEAGRGGGWTNDPSWDQDHSRHAQRG